MPSRRKNDLSVDVYIPFVETLFRDGLTLSDRFRRRRSSSSSWSTARPATTPISAWSPVSCWSRPCGCATCASIATRRGRSIARRRAGARTTTSSTAPCMADARHVLLPRHLLAPTTPSPRSPPICVTLASATAISGRNYGSPRMVLIFIITMTWPMSLGVHPARRRLPCHARPAVDPVPSARSSASPTSCATCCSRRLSEEKKANRLAQRFNRALNTMSHGLVMLGPDGGWSSPMPRPRI